MYVMRKDQITDFSETASRSWVLVQMESSFYNKKTQIYLVNKLTHL